MTVTEKLGDTTPLPQALVPFTVITPVPGVVKFTLILLVLPPEIIVAPVGTVQTYPVAFAIAGTEYVTEVAPSQTAAGPVIVPAFAGNGFTTTANVDGAPFPQLLVPVTIIFTDTAVGPKLTVILVVPAPVAMVAPAGRVQV